jgi:hypothetical protein
MPPKGSPPNAEENGRSTDAADLLVAELCVSSNEPMPTRMSHYTSGRFGTEIVPPPLPPLQQEVTQEVAPPPSPPLVMQVGSDTFEAVERMSQYTSGRSGPYVLEPPGLPDERGDRCDLDASTEQE